MEQGMIFDIAHSSFVDGPGVRTTVFFKGCNLACRWCHNPESQKLQPQMLFYQNKCTGCGTCKAVCPHGLSQCDLCTTCTQYCPVSARKVCGHTAGTEQILKEILADEMFYQFSGGGVTFSGGECMLQIEFLKTLLQKCKENSIHTAVDTAGHVPWEYFEQIMPYTDLFLYDVKCFTEALHKEGTGVTNKRILENLKKLSECFTGKILIRIPVIPGFNMDTAEMTKIAAFLKQINCTDIELLPYHKLGENKYSAIDLEQTVYTVPSKEEMAALEQLFHT